ncbi:MAG TPA: hypothetical protein VM290_00580 [Gaiellaceae bacterium]|nr:hypothetical protein [Gaiellaceae bacterium]
MENREQLRAEVESTLEARRELGADLEPQLVESFLDRIERQLDERRAAAPAARGLDSGQRTGIAIVSIVAAIPLVAIASGAAGLPAVAVVCLALVLVNVVAAR